MSITKSNSASLANKFAIGEIADFVGVPDFYDAGPSKWMKTGTWVDGALLPAATRTNLKAGASTKVAMTDNAMFTGCGTYCNMNALSPLAKTASVVAIPFTTQNSGTACKALVIDATGIRAVSIGQVAGTATPENDGGGNIITSDGTKLWSWTSVTANKFDAYSSTDGLVWTKETLTGQMNGAFGVHRIGPSGVNAHSSILKCGERFVSSQVYQLGAYWCGARHLLVGVSATGDYLTAQLSSNGTTWGGDVSAAVWGSATLGHGAYAWFYRNGMNCFLSHQAQTRVTTDGGITWSESTNAQHAGSNYYRINATDPARLASNNNTTDMRFSTNSGLTWTTRISPTTLATSTVQGRGATWVVCNTVTGAAFKTADDGATWTTIVAPSGFVGTMQGVFADANRWYMVSAAGNQVATSTDLITWTVRNISNPAPSTDHTYAPFNMVATDANNIMGASETGGTILSSSDGGVTWAWASSTSSTEATGISAKYYIANTVGSPSFICGVPNALKTSAVALLASDLALGGKSFRSTVSAVTSLRSGALAYSRIA